LLHLIDFLYHLRIAHGQGDFALRTAMSGLAVRTGSAVKLTVYALRKEETNSSKLDLAKEQLALKQEEFSLERKKYQRTTCELFIKWFKNRKVEKIIQDKSTNNDVKSQALGRELFGDLWDD